MDELTSLGQLAQVSPFVIVAVAGATEFIKRLWVRDYQAATIIAVSAAIGAVAGAFVIDGLTVATGLMAGLAASGAITLAQKFGFGTTATPTTLRR